METEEEGGSSLGIEQPSSGGLDSNTSFVDASGVPANEDVVPSDTVIPSVDQPVPSSSAEGPSIASEDVIAAEPPLQDVLDAGQVQVPSSRKSIPRARKKLRKGVLDLDDADDNFLVVEFESETEAEVEIPNEHKWNTHVANWMMHVTKDFSYQQI